jgi:hypothetical protein
VIRPVLAGLVAGVVVYLLSRTARETPRQQFGRNWVEYSTGYKFLSGAFFPLSAFVTYGATQASPDQKTLAGLIALAFWAGTLYLAYEICFVSLSYDDTFIYHQSPLRGSRKIPMNAVTDMQYSPLTQAFRLITDSHGDISVSPMANGAKALLEAIAAQSLEH